MPAGTSLLKRASDKSVLSDLWQREAVEAGFTRAVTYVMVRDVVKAPYGGPALVVSTGSGPLTLFSGRRRADGSVPFRLVRGDIREVPPRLLAPFDPTIDTNDTTPSDTSDDTSDAGAAAANGDVVLTVAVDDAFSTLLHAASAAAAGCLRPLRDPAEGVERPVGTRRPQGLPPR